MSYKNASVLRWRRILAVFLIMAMVFSQTVPAAAEPAQDEGQAAEQPGQDEAQAAEETQPAEDEQTSVSGDEDAKEDPAPDTSLSGDTVSGDTVSEDTVSEDSVSEDSVSEDSVSEDSASENEAEEDAGADGQYDFNAVRVSDNKGYTYPGVFSVSAGKTNGAVKEIGIPCISNTALKDDPTTESPAIIMGAAVPYEKRSDRQSLRFCPARRDSMHPTAIFVTRSSRRQT